MHRSFGGCFHVPRASEKHVSERSGDPANRSASPVPVCRVLPLVIPVPLRRCSKVNEESQFLQVKQVRVPCLGIRIVQAIAIYT